MKPERPRIEILQEFHAAPDDALFDQVTVAAVRDCKPSTLERDRWAGGGIPYRKLRGRHVRYQKRDVLVWLNQHAPVTSTTAAGQRQGV